MRLQRRLSTLFAAAVILMAAGMIVPAAHGQAQLVTYFNFNDQNETADPPGTQLTPTITQQNLSPSFVPGTTINQATGDPTGAGSALRLGFTNNGGGNAKSFQFTVSTVNFSNLSLSYATRTSVAGITQTLSYSTDGTTFINAGTFTPTASFTTASFTLPIAVENQLSVTFRVTLTGAGGNRQEFNDFDNIQLKGTEVPEPATIGAALLCALGVCWHQRRLFWKALQLSRFKVRAAA